MVQLMYIYVQTETKKTYHLLLKLKKTIQIYQMLQAFAQTHHLQ